MQIVIPGVDAGTIIAIPALEFLQGVKALFPEITALDPKNLPNDTRPAESMSGGLPKLPAPPKPNLVGMGPDPEALAQKWVDNQAVSGKRFGMENSSSPAPPTVPADSSAPATKGEVLLG